MSNKKSSRGMLLGVSILTQAMEGESLATQEKAIETFAKGNDLESFSKFTQTKEYLGGSYH